MDVTAQPVTRSVTASGDVVIPSVAVDEPEPEDPDEPVVIGNTEEQTITVSLDTGMCIASISGQSMGASAAWDGRIVIEEYVDLFRIGNGSQTDRLQVKSYQPSTNLPVAYASNDVNATANTKRGSMNLTESTKLTDG